MAHKKTKKTPAQGKLQGWKAIANYLGISASAAQRWAEGGMPVRREGRFTVADPEDLRRWLGRESHMPEPAHIVTPQTDMSAALMASISATRRTATCLMLAPLPLTDNRTHDRKSDKSYRCFRSL